MFIYENNNKSHINLDNGVKLTIHFDEYEAVSIGLPDTEFDASSDFCKSFYVMKGGALVLVADLLKAADRHMDLCRKEDDQQSEDHASHIQSVGRQL